MNVPSEFEALMEQAAAGSEDAIWKLAETYTPYVIRSVRVLMSDKLRARFDSQDVAQALWASLLLGESELFSIKSPEALIAFLTRVAKNKVIDQTRQHHAQRRDVSRE